MLMATYPWYQDSLAHEQFGKSRLPILVVQNTLSHAIPLHHHSFAELSLVIAGSGTETINGHSFAFEPGTVAFLLPHHIHEIQPKQSPVLKYTCMFDVSLLCWSESDRELADILLQTGVESPSHYHLNDKQTAHMADLFQTMMDEYENQAFAKDIALRSRLLDAFIYLLRHASVSEKPASAFAVHENRTRLAESILHYLHVHYQEEITLYGVAEQFGVNASYMSRMFKRVSGRTFIEYLHSLRVQRAASLLATTSMSVTDIAIDVGFDQTRTFTRAFKEIFGTTPKQYRAVLRERLAEAEDQHNIAYAFNIVNC